MSRRKGYIVETRTSPHEPFVWVVDMRSNPVFKTFAEAQAAADAKVAAHPGPMQAQVREIKL